MRIHTRLFEEYEVGDRKLMHNNARIALFTIANKADVFRDFKENLSKQKSINYQLIEIANYNGEYNSARLAFNEYANISDVEYYAFLHPDVRFIDEYALSDLVRIIDEIDDFGVVGVAGARRNGNKREIVTTIIQGEHKREVGTKIRQPVEVQTVDECFFVIRRDYFQNHKFSNRNGWHLYGVEYCLDAIRNGKKG